MLDASWWDRMLKRLRGVDPSFAHTAETRHLKSSAKFETNHCSKFAVVIGSERVKSRTNGSTRAHRKWLRNIVEYTIFKTSQKSRQCYESAALTSCIAPL